MRKLTVAIVGKTQADGLAVPLLEIAEFIDGGGHRAVFDENTGQAVTAAVPDHGHLSWSIAEIGQNADLAVVVGGDGTMLGIARQLAPYNVPLIGINQGRLGFMTDIPLEDKIQTLTDMLAGKYEVEERGLLQAHIVRNGETIFEALALNDVVVSRGTGSGMAELTVDVDGCFMYSQRSDGLIVATPTGSTAYALSANGPILHPRLNGVVLVPIAPHALSNRPIALPDTSRIDITVTGGREVSANFDMQTFAALQLGDRVSIQRAPMSIHFLHPVGYSYYATLREKLGWNENPGNRDGKPAAKPSASSAS